MKLHPQEKIVSQRALVAIREGARRRGQRFVFTNGCFDLLHGGHARLLTEARQLGDSLAVGLNGDASVRRLKGAGRPILPFKERALVLASLAVVDYVVKFTADTPLRLITALRPDVLVKGGDYALEAVVGAEVVWSAGGEVRTLPITRGQSTSRLIEHIVELHAPTPSTRGEPQP